MPPWVSRAPAITSSATSTASFPSLSSRSWRRAKTFLAKIKQDVFKGDVVHPLSANDDARTIQKVQSGAGVVGVVSDVAARSLPADVAVLPLR